MSFDELSYPHQPHVGGESLIINACLNAVGGVFFVIPELYSHANKAESLIKLVIEMGDKLFLHQWGRW